MHGHGRCVGHETCESYRKTKGGMMPPYFRGHENPATIFRSLKLTRLSLRDMVGVTRFLGTPVLAAVGSRVLDGDSPNGLYVSQIPGIYSLVSQKLAWTMLTRMCESIRESLVL